MTNLTKEVLKSPRYLEALLVVVVFSATSVMLSYSVDHPVMLHLFYVPVVLTGFFRGAYRARLMSLLCILTATTVFLPSFNEAAAGGVPLGPVFAFMLWAATLVLIAVIVGTLSDGWRESIDKLRVAHEKDVLTDALTGVANRRAFEYELNRRLTEWNRDQTPFCLVLLDIDHFKKFNDRYGHQAGDAVLEAVAKVLKEAVRETDLVARHGGEEFGVVVSGASVEKVKNIAERARSLIESSRFPHRGLMLRVTVSLGVAQIQAGEDLTSLVQRADTALYCSKEAGRNCVHFHDGKTCLHFGEGMATDVMDPAKKTTSESFDVYTDETTGLPTQKVFLEEFRRRTLEAHRHSSELAVAIISIDGLLQEEDPDAQTQKNLLATIGRLSGSVLRETDLIARYDGNCLSVLLPATSLESALIPMQRLSSDSAKYSDFQYPSLSYSVSIGLVEVMTAEPPGSALQRVEAALAASIAAGGNSLYVHDGTACQLAGANDLVGEAV
ncbi:MAG: diguanylate cyclase [Planctomycetes bacterium]|nr:diguanylate cyclase [Planctomycetota bacterium]